MISTVALPEKVKEVFLLVFIEFRGPAAPETRSKSVESSLVPLVGPPISSGFGASDTIRRLFDKLTLIEVFEKRETADDIVIVRLGQRFIEFGSVR